MKTLFSVLTILSSIAYLLFVTTNTDSGLLHIASFSVIGILYCLSNQNLRIITQSFIAMAGVGYFIIVDHSFLWKIFIILMLSILIGTFDLKSDDKEINRET